MFACDEIQSFHNKNRENKRYDRMCLLKAGSHERRKRKRKRKHKQIDV